MLTKPQYHRLLTRIRKSAQREAAALLKSLPKDFKERLASVPAVALRFEDRQPQDPHDHRAAPVLLSLTSRDTQEIIINVMTIFEQCGMEPGAFRESLRRVIMHELGDWVGLDVATTD